MKRLIGYISVVAIALCMSGCSLLMPSFDCDFENWTDHTVYVTNIDGGSPSNITLGAYDTETVRIKSDKISFTYSPSNLVYSQIYSSLNDVCFYSR